MNRFDCARTLALGWLLVCGWTTALLAADEGFPLQPNDHICIVGNTLAERMQHSGWLETLLHARYPKHQLVIRNLGFSGDEIDFSKRLRSMDFGTPDQWLAGEAPVPQPTKLSPKDQVRENRFELTNTKADVIFVFFGYNESFAGPAGLDAFKSQLQGYLQHLAGQKYNGKSAPRVVLFSPTAFEDLKSPHLPNGEAINQNLSLYTAAMADVARGAGVTFVDLFSTSRAAFAKIAEPVTINGVHMNDRGDLLVAQLIDAALSPGKTALKADSLAALRAAILDKNFHWFHRYRTTDGYSTYGDRAFLKFAEGPGGYGEGQSNYSVMQRELEVLDQMVSNRDQVIWAAAQGKTVAPDDANVSPFLPVISNKPGPLEGGKHLFLHGEEAIAKMTVHPELEVTQFASEQQFPELINPVQMAFDTKGRLWVATWPTYPHWIPGTPMNDRLLILEDTNGDGRADVCKTFDDTQHNPTGFEFWGGGVLVANAPDLYFLKDNDGDDRVDEKIRVLHGLDSADTHHAANSFMLDPGGALYFQEGTFHHSQVESPWKPSLRLANAGVFRYEPRTHKVDVYVSFGFANPHGHAFDRWGQDIVVDGTGSNPFHAALFSGHLDYPNKHARPPQVYQQRTRPCPGIEYLSSRHFPESVQGNLAVGNVIGFQGILQYKVFDEGASYSAVEQEPIVSSSDPNFRPSDLEVGPDGALYFTDWQNPIIGHMQHNLRDPSRDKIHGRVYRVTAKSRPLLKPESVAGETVPVLLQRLTSPEDRVRLRARIELSARPTSEVIAAAEAQLQTIQGQDEAAEHQRLELLWLHQSHDVINQGLLERMLSSPDFRARAAAVRVLCYWRDRVSGALELLKNLAADDHPRVRLEAVRAASFFPMAEAIEVSLIAAELPSDIYLDFVQGETRRALDPYVKEAQQQNRRVAFTTAAGARFFLRNLTNEQLLKEDRTRTVLLEMLTRPGLSDDVRREAVTGLAEADQKPELTVIIDAIRMLDRSNTASSDVSVVFDLVRQLTARPLSELSAVRSQLEQLALTAQQPIFRQVGFVSLINSDETVEPAWALAVKNGTALQDFVAAMPLISDPSLRATLYDKVAPLLEGLPEAIPAALSQGTLGRYVRIDIPGRATLTLAEVEVYSQGANVARQGRAIQKNTSHGGDAARAIDGNTSGSYGSNSQTHTEELTGNPYWEVDLGQSYPIDHIVIYNRTDGDLGSRLNGFTLTVLDDRRATVFQKKEIPAPAVKHEQTLEGGGLAARVRRAAMIALTQVRGKEQQTFRALAGFVLSGTDRLDAVRALQRLPRNTWPADLAPQLLTVITDGLANTPVAQRTEDAALDQLEFADGLVSLLPAEQAKAQRARLRELGVRVVRVGTVFERMAFDQDVIVVQAGKPVEFLLDNTDLMPHNFVIVRPGSLEEVGLLAEAQAQQPGFAERHYVPDSPQVLLSSRLLQPRQSQKLSFEVPSQPGVYPFVCTYPGHWRRMYGALYVVEDLDAYQANAEEYLATHRVEAVDLLLKDRRPRTAWTLADLSPAVAKPLSGRNFGNGKQMFAVASCTGCHRLEGVGNQFGPDLMQLDIKTTQADLLQHLIEPSAKIHEKFQNSVFELTSGQVVSGLVVSENDTTVEVVENPLVSAQPRRIPKSEIDDRNVSKSSLMPKGLLDKLTQDEILDLMAYVLAKGKKDHPAFGKSEHGDHGHGDH
jgi:putative heme-binding domain-containing protein